MFKFARLLFVLVIVLSIGCESIKEDLYNRKHPPLKSINPAHLDISTRPTEDFFQFTNGKWIASQKEAPNRSNWDDMHVLAVNNDTRLMTILKDTNKKEIAINRNLESLQTYYEAFYDFTSRKQQTDVKIEDIKAKMASVHNKSELPNILHAFASQKINTLFELKVGPCPRESETNTLYFSQTTLSLQDKNLYTGDINNGIQNEYIAYISQFFELMDLKASKERALSVFNFERSLASIHVNGKGRSTPPEELQTVEFEEASALLQFFDIRTFLEEANVPQTKWIVLEQASYIKELNELYAETDVSVLKDYLTWKYVEHYAPFLDESFAKYHTRFSDALTRLNSSTIKSAHSADTGLEKRVVKVHKAKDADILAHLKRSLFQPVLSYEFSHRFFSKYDKVKVGQIIESIYQSSQEKVKENPWMDEETKLKALRKIKSMTVKVGYSAVTPEIKPPKLSTNNCLKNMDNCNAHSFQIDMNKLSLRSNSHAWTTPSFANKAHYNPVNNSLEIPAGIIQPPFFDDKAADVYNYSKVGVLIAREILHSFDEIGRHFNESGTYSDWWSTADKSRFSALSLKLGETFSQFCPFKMQCIDEKQTANENIAELGGLAIAYHAYSKTNEFNSDRKQKGYTPSQAFFISYAQMQKSVYSERKLKSILKYESYSPAKYRVNGTLMNFSEFHKAFETEMGNNMWKNESKIPLIW